MLSEITVIFCIITFWFSIALTEGWKWRLDRQQPDNHPVIDYRSYHVWRGVTNASVLALALSGGQLASVLVLLAFAAGWATYELAMSWVEYDTMGAPRPDFHILGKTYKRPGAWMYKTVVAVSLIAIVVVFVAR